MCILFIVDNGVVDLKEVKEQALMLSLLDMIFNLQTFLTSYKPLKLSASW